MSDTPAKPGETAAQGTVSNDGSQPSAPAPAPAAPAAPAAEDNTSSAKLDQLQKQLDQERMRNNQLSNQLTDKEKAEEETRRKQLEEKEEFKTLYEQTQSQLDEIKNTQEEQQRHEALTTATKDVFKDYPTAVVELAETAGLGLTENTDEARNALKEKLDAFKAKVPSKAGVNPNNPHEPAQSQDAEGLTKRDENGVSPMAMAAAKGNLEPTYKYIQNLPAIQRMKEIAKGA